MPYLWNLRYFTSMKLLQKGQFEPNIAGVALVALTIGTVAGGGIVMVIFHDTKAGLKGNPS